MDVINALWSTILVIIAAPIEILKDLATPVLATAAFVGWLWSTYPVEVFALNVFGMAALLLADRRHRRECSFLPTV